jgi:hypothetical protein
MDIDIFISHMCVCTTFARTCASKRGCARTYMHTFARRDACVPDERIADAGPPHHTCPRAAPVRAHVCVCDRARTHPRRHMRARSVGVDRVRLRRAGVLLGVGVQRERRIVERTACYHLHFWVQQRRPCGLHQARRVRQLGVDAANGVPDVELALSVRDAGSEHHAIDGHAEVRMPAGACDYLCQGWLLIFIRACAHAPGCVD